MIRRKYFMSDNRQGKSTSDKDYRTSPQDDESSRLTTSPLALKSVVLPEVRRNIQINRWAPSQGRVSSTEIQGGGNSRTTGRPNNRSLQLSSNRSNVKIMRPHHTHADEEPIQRSQNNGNDTMERLIASRSIHEVVQDNSIASGNAPTNSSVAASLPLLNDRRPSPRSEDDVHWTQRRVVDGLAHFAAQSLLNGLWRFPGHGGSNQQQTAAATNNIVSSGGSSSGRMNNSEILSSIGMCQPVSQLLGDINISAGKRSVKTRRVPCRARGMAPTHNAETAYFEVPENVKHGDELVCPYPECRNAGVKFCFCTHCNIPVAKRNFRIRHNHCDYAPPAPKVAESFLFPTQDTKLHGSPTKVRSTPTNSSRRRHSGADSSSCSSSSIRSDKKRKAVDSSVPPPPPVPQIATRINTAGPDARFPPRYHSTSHGDAGSDGDASSVSDLGMNEIEVTAERMAAWDQLLERRPRPLDSAEMHTWLMTVLAISDANVPIQQTGTSSGRTSTEPLPSSDLLGDDHRKISKRPKR